MAARFRELVQAHERARVLIALAEAGGTATSAELSVDCSPSSASEKLNIARECGFVIGTRASARDHKKCLTIWTLTDSGRVVVRYLKGCRRQASPPIAPEVSPQMPRREVAPAAS